MKNVKRSLFTSAVSLLLCFVMLLGTTFAWFTDSAVSANNIITTGNLNVSMYWSENNTDWNNAEGLGARPVFDYDNWEPGYTEVRYIKVANEGNLSFKYLMYINPTGVVGALADVIDVSYDIVTGNDGFTAPTTMYNMGSLRKIGTLSQIISEEKEIPGGVLLPDGKTSEGCYTGEVVYCVAFHMQEEAGNEYMGKSIGDSFGITLHATQYNYESDSFGPNYDTDAEWPEKPVYDSGIGKLENSSVVYGALTREVTISGNNISATIPADVKVDGDVDSLGLAVSSVEVDVNLSLKDGESARSYDVHISGISADNTKPMIVNLGAVLPAGIDATELKLYHTENGTPVQMTRVASTADFARHNQYVYDPATGEVSIFVATFSTFSMVKTSASRWEDNTEANTDWYGDGSADEFTLYSVADFLGFRDLVDAGTTFAGKTVKLETDIDLNNINFDPIGFGYTYNKPSDTAFMGTFDGGNHTIYNLYQNGWDLDSDKVNYSTYTYSTAGGGLFASIENATIKNLVMDGADITFECVDIGIVVGYAQGNCHFENIIVTNSTIANYNRATGAVVGEVCYGSYGTDASTGNYSHTFNNIVVDSNVVVSSLWGSFDTLIGGVIGGKWGDATVKMENVITAAELDVYSDVTAAYQWYAYRRCGMLIGHTEQNSPKSALNAAAEFLTCENVKVYYGDWVNYNYYEFAKQDSDTGKRYPWVRAEASPVGNNGAFSNPRYGVPTHTVNGEIITVNNENKDTYKTGYAAITFNQLYGGGQGVYGCAEHDGVITNSKESQTIYVHNNSGWTNLKLQYWFANGDDTWTTIIDGIDMSTMLVEGNVYKIQLPATASTFKIVADGGNATKGIDISTLNNNDNYCIGHAVVVDEAVAPTCTATGLTEGSHCSVCNATLVAQTVVPALGHNMSNITITDDADFQKNGKETVSCANDGCNYSTTRDIVAKSLIYLTPNANWKVNNARFAAYFFGNGEKWVSMTDFDGDGTYECEVPAGYPSVIFCRMNPNASANNWNNKWNQTSDLTVPTNRSNHYTVTEGAWDKGSGNWSELKYKTIYLTPNNNWTADGARFAVYTWHRNDNEDEEFNMWINMTDVDGDGTYEAYIREGYKFILCRMNPAYTDNAWNNETETDRVWAQTADMVYNGSGESVEYTVSDKVYFTPNAEWKQSNARFAAYFFGNGEKWVSMTDPDGDGTYECEVPAGYTSVIFCRMNPSTSANNWNNKWNQTGDLTIPDNGKNLYSVPEGSWDNSDNGCWSTQSVVEVKK